MKRFALQNRNLLYLILLSCNSIIAQYDTLSSNSPLINFSGYYPFNFLSQDLKQQKKGKKCCNRKEIIHLSASFSAERALLATDASDLEVPIGDVHGRWNMIGLLYGKNPSKHVETPLLYAASQEKFNGPAAQSTSNGASANAAVSQVAINVSKRKFLSDETRSDLQKQFGFFSAPTKYQKMGARLFFSARPFGPFVFQIETGFCNIKHTLEYQSDPYSGVGPAPQITPIKKGLFDKTQESDCKNVHSFNYEGSEASLGLFDLDKDLIERVLMDKHVGIFQELNLDASSFMQSAQEDTILSCIVRHSFAFNENEDPSEWAAFLMTPFVKFSGILATGLSKDTSKLLSVSTGNNGHNAIAISSGIHLDFYETLEIGASGQVTHYLNQNIADMHVPNSHLQSVLYPYTTDVNVQPGLTWSANFSANGHNLIDRMSLYTIYSYINHQKDSIKLISFEDVFKPERLENDTPFIAQYLTMGASYDLSANVSCAANWQVPVAVINAFKTSSINLSFSGSF